MTVRVHPDDLLVVVDVQNDFCPGGSLAVGGGDAVVPAVNELASRFRNVVLTQDWHPAGHASFASTHGREPFGTVELPYGMQVLWPDHCVQGTPGADFHPALSIPHAQAIVRKGHDVAVDSYSGFQEADRRTRTGLDGYVASRRLGSVFVVGLALDFCVAWTAIDASRIAGRRTYVVRDATAAIDLDGSLDRALADMARADVDVVMSADLEFSRAD